MQAEQEQAFLDIIDVFDKEGLLPYVMLIGSWAEYMYQHYFKSDYSANLRTRDVDFLYRNINRPKSTIKIIERLKEKGFVYREDVLSKVGKFVKEDLLEIEFLTRSIGKGSNTSKILSIGITAESLRTVNMLADYPLKIDYNNYIITVPEPEAYIIQKLWASPTRTPEYKKEKDLHAIRSLIKYTDGERLKHIFKNMPDKAQKIIQEVRIVNFIEI